MSGPGQASPVSESCPERARKRGPPCRSSAWSFGIQMTPGGGGVATSSRAAESRSASPSIGTSVDAGRPAGGRWTQTAPRRAQGRCCVLCPNTRAAFPGRGTRNVTTALPAQESGSSPADGPREPASWELLKPCCSLSFLSLFPLRARYWQGHQTGKSMVNDLALYPF